MVESSNDTGTRGARLAAPRPEVLASMTDQNVLFVISGNGVPMSRAEVAEATGLSKPAVSAAAARLAERGVLRDVGVREGRRGGVATLFELNPDHGRSLAVIIQNDAITVQARDLRGQIRACSHAAVELGDEPARIIATTNNLIERASSAFDAPLLAAAVSIADPVDTARSEPVVLTKSVFPAAAIRPASDLDLSEAAHLVVDNDVNWATLGEFRKGDLAGRSDFIYVYFGQGLGAGLLLNGRLFRGHRGLAGEIGYLQSADGDELDLTERLVRLGLGTSAHYGIDLAKANRILSQYPLSIEAQAVADLLGLAVANLAIVINPSAIAFGGPLSVHPDFTAALAERIRACSVDPPQFVTSETSPLLGAGLEAHRLALEEAGVPHIPRSFQ